MEKDCNTFFVSEKNISFIRNNFSEYESRYITQPKFVFLCGKQYDTNNKFEKTNRDVISEFIKKQNPNIIAVKCEDLWKDDYFGNTDMLTYEELLADISDAIIIFTESCGSYCELGAFADDVNRLTEKLIIVNDKKYEGAQSFLTKGPLAKAEAHGAKVAYADVELGGILHSDKLRKIIFELLKEFDNEKSGKNKRVINKSDLVCVDSFILELLEIIELCQPISSSNLASMYKRIKGIDKFNIVRKDGAKFNNDQDYIDFSMIVNFLITTNLIEINDEEKLKIKDANVQAFMFNKAKYGKDKMRSRVLCDQYKTR